jgi:Flp pilus assembly protein TadD
LHLTAFRYLVTDAMAHKSVDRAILYSQLVIEDPHSAYPDKLALLDILHESNNPRFPSWKTTLETQAVSSPADASALGHWMQTQETPNIALQWLRSLPPATQTNYPLPIIVSDCQVALHDWTGLEAFVEKQNWGQLDYYRLLLASLAARNLGQNLGSEAAWAEAFQLCVQHLDRLAKLNEMTAAWGWTAERRKVLQKISLEFPGQTWANDQLAALYYADGNTQALAGLLDQMSTADPSNARLKSDLATVLLLQKSNPDKARRLALESYNSSTNNPFCACTYAYSLLLQSKPKEAVKILSSLDAGYLKNPSIAGFYGVVEAEAGDWDAARAPLQVAEGGNILPEEKELVREVAARQ